MAYSFTEKKRIRKDFGKLPGILKVPYLLSIQLDSYRQFLQEKGARKREDMGLHAAFKSVFPIVSYSGNAALEYVSYRLGEPVFDVKECQLRGLTYAAPLRVLVRLIIYDKESSGAKKKVKDIREQEVYIGEMPLDDRERHLRHQRHRARHRLAAAPLAGRVLRSRQGQDALLRQAAVFGAGHSLPRLLARLRVRSEGLRVRAHRPAPQAAGQHHAARARVHGTRRSSTCSSRRTSSRCRKGIGSS
jgi:hypothetical protein